MNKQILQKLVIYTLAVSGGMLLTFAIDSGEVKDYIFGIIPLITGLFYVFMEAKK